MLNEADLLPNVDVDLGQYPADLRCAAPEALLPPFPATAGDGVCRW